MFWTIIAMIFSVAALAIAVGNLSRTKRLKTAVYAHREWLEQQFCELRAEWSRNREELHQQQVPPEEVTIGRERWEAIERRQNECEHKVEHLFGEAQNLAMLPGCHPTRESLIQELQPRLEPVMNRLTAVLFPSQIAMDDFDWMYRLTNRKFPYSLTFEEGVILHYLIAANGLQSGYEIATAFGMSSFFIAMALEKTGGHLTSADAYIEEEMEDFIYNRESARLHVETLCRLRVEEQYDELPVGLKFALEGAATLGVESRVDYPIACSPDGVPDLLEGKKLDFAFIDGGHFGEQPLLDVQSVLPFLSGDKYLVLFHDTQCEAVAKAVHFAAAATGTEPFSIHTRNRLVALTKGLDEATLQTCRAMTLRQAV